MGGYQCTNCFVHVRDEDLVKEDIEKKKKFVLLIQRVYRGYLFRKKYKKSVTKLHKYKKKKLVNSENIISFRDNWDFYFKFPQKYEFSLGGLKKLINELKDFYLQFFSGTVDSNLGFSTKRNIKGVKMGLAAKKSKYLSSREKKDENSILFTIEMLQSISTPNDFKNIFKIYFFSHLSQIFDIGELGKNVSEIKFKIEKLNDNSSETGVSVSDNSIIEKEIENIVSDLPREKLIEKSEPYFAIILEEIECYEKKFCTINSFKDNQNANYQGSTKDNTLLKWGLGKEYYIEQDDKAKKESKVKYRYCGYYQNSAFHGVGLLVKENGECYFGEFREGHKHGLGFLYTPSFSYKGFFFKDKFEGYGEFAKNHLFYCGSFKDGLFEGFGYLETDVTSICVGTFKNGKLEGEGCYKWSSGEIYYGSWSYGKMNGFGEFRWKNGDKYIGNYENDLKHGKGEYVFKNGSVLRGNWIKGKKEGNFTLQIYEDDSPRNRKKGEYTIKYHDDTQVK